MKNDPKFPVKKELVIIGAGPAGLAAAVAARDAGVQDIVLLERDSQPGGILNQCIHNGFGLHTFGEELTGPEYASRYIEQVNERQIPIEQDTMVLDISEDRLVTCVSPRKGIHTYQAKAIVLAMGCRERPRGALQIPGYRPAGIYAAGTAQKLTNIDGFLPGKEVVILGSGDIGLIMARRMVLEGAHVHAVVEVMPYSGGLKRNIVQCLEDYNIPLLLSHTVVDIQGKDRVKQVTIAQVDENRQPVSGTEKVYPCDTLLLSCGLIPENELSAKAGIALHPITHGPVVNDCLETSLSGVFACGNVLHVHDLVDFVSQEAAQAGQKAAAFIQRSCVSDRKEGLTVETDGKIRYTVPTILNPATMEDLQTLRFRVDRVYRQALVQVLVDGQPKLRKKCRILSPGEMETIVLRREWLKDASHIQVGIQEEEA